MKRLIGALAVSSAVIVAMAADKDPVLMTVDGRDVHVSEFQYLYNKNNSQQVEPLTFDQYVDMFVDYKLKVADALAAGIDTTEAFRSEFGKFRDELAEPYMRDAAVLESLINEAYAHMQRDIKISHIMLPPTVNGVDTKATLDSIRAEILAGNVTFADAAMAHSADRGTNQRGGSMGWINGNSRLPWAFEEVAYNTPVGTISEVVNSGFGNHIILVEDERPARGQVKAEHILLLTRDLTPDEVAAKKIRIDSIYKAAADGANFAELARKYSEDPGSARRGGDLGWFGSGMMVVEFDSVAFAMPVGAVSQPFTTNYGYHIIHKSDARGVAPLDEVRSDIEKAIEKDQRSRLPLQATLDRAAAASNAKLSDDISSVMLAEVSKIEAPLTPDKLQQLNDITATAYVIDGVPTTIGQVLANHPLRPGLTPEGVVYYTEQYVKNDYERALMKVACDNLANDNADYRNLINEYSDGIMLFDISNEKVWDKASKDKAGLERYFDANRDKYVWDAPKFKSYVIFASNDSTLDAAMDAAAAYALANPTFTQEELTSTLRSACGRDVKVEKVIAAKGENSITDYLGFGANKPASSNSKWSCYKAFQGRVINAPEEAADVKGAVIADYQNALEKEWLDYLHKTYKVKINKKVLNQLKKQDK